MFLISKSRIEPKERVRRLLIEYSNDRWRLVYVISERESSDSISRLIFDVAPNFMLQITSMTSDIAVC